MEEAVNRITSVPLPSALPPPSPSALLSLPQLRVLPSLYWHFVRAIEEFGGEETKRQWRNERETLLDRGFLRSSADKQVDPVDTGLNTEQLIAVRNALSCSSLPIPYLIHGPPGMCSLSLSVFFIHSFSFSFSLSLFPCFLFLFSARFLSLALSLAIFC